MDAQSLNSSWVVVEESPIQTDSGRQKDQKKSTVVQMDTEAINSEVVEAIDSEVVEKEEVVDIEVPEVVPVDIPRPDPGTSSLVILTPKKHGTQIFLTPVRRSKRKIISGLKEGRIRMNDGSIKVQETGQPYVSLVECFKQLQKAPKSRRESIDVIVQKYLRK